MKKGEEYICIKNVHNYYRDIDNISHIEGKIYKVASDNGIMNDGEYVYIESEKNTTFRGYLGFFVSGNRYYYKDWDVFNKHFITIKNARKLKLQKLKKYDKSR